jgi:predicted dehydrogenase
MAEPPLKVGVVGADPTGRGFGPRAHLPAVLAAPGLELFAVCTAHDATAAAAAERWGAARWYADIDAMCRDPDLDLITVSVRVRLHRPIVEAALANGKAVYCEWPLGLDPDDAAALVELVRDRRIVNGVGTQGRFSPAIRLAHELLGDGRIGRPLTFAVTHQLSRFPVDEDRGWLARDEEASGALHVATAHVTDTVRYLLGDVAELAGLATTMAPAGAYADTGGAFTWTAHDVVGYVCRLVSGIPGVVHVTNLASPSVGFALRIFGDEGSLTISAPGYISFARARVVLGMPDGTSSELELPQRYKEGIELPDEHPGLNVGLALLAMARGIRSGGVFHPDFADALALHRIVEAIARSQSEGRWERLTL